jgi:hypothetical protein
MPNWCENVLHLESKNFEQVKRIYNYVKENQKLFSFIDALPQDYNNKDLSEQELINLHGHKDWYDWQVSHWGTKWDIDLYHIDIDDTPDYASLNISFGTAWSPAGDNILTKILQFLDDTSAGLTNLFYEPGMSFIGESTLFFSDEGDVSCSTIDFHVPSYDCFSNKDYRQVCLDIGISDDLIDNFNLEENMYEMCVSEVGQEE